MSIVFLVIIGAAAGFLATRLMGVEAGIIPTVAVGIGGALIGGLILRALLSLQIRKVRSDICSGRRTIIGG